jgi:very-short-patch-repair endonuclease
MARLSPCEAHDLLQDLKKKAARARKRGASTEKKRDLEGEMLSAIRRANLPEPKTEYRFHPKRAWRLDFAWPALKLALEVEGGHWGDGRHTRGAGYTEDCAKYSCAAIAGWRVIRVTSTMMDDGTALDLLRAAFTGDMLYAPPVPRRAPRAAREPVTRPRLPAAPPKPPAPRGGVSRVKVGRKTYSVLPNGQVLR